MGLVRADAIRAALVKGQDYAAALGGAVLTVEHIADAGLLGSGGERVSSGPWQAQALGSSAAGSAAGATSLDPVPQIVQATIDARLTATVGALPSR